MFNLLSGKVNPELGKIVLKVEQQRVEAVAHPVFEERPAKAEPIMMVSENYKYSLKAGVSASYIAEGTISFPHLAPADFTPHLVFESSEPKLGVYFLTIGEGKSKKSGDGESSIIIINSFFEKELIGEKKHRPALAKIVAENIVKYFFKDVHPRLRPYSIHLGLLVDKARSLASDSYFPSLERLLKENPAQEILPKTYIYPIDEKTSTLIPNSVNQPQL